MSEDVATADLAEENALGRIIQKPDVIQWCIVIAPQ